MDLHDILNHLGSDNEEDSDDDDDTATRKKKATTAHVLEYIENLYNCTQEKTK